MALFALAAIMNLLGMQAFAATLTNEIVEPSNNLFSLESHYVIGFTTATMGTIKVITITFPTGFNIANAKLILASGIGSGAISVAGQTLTYTVNSAVSVPAGIGIIFDFGKIVNNAVASNTVSVTTKDSSSVTIDGPTTSPTFTLTSATSTMLGTNTVTNTKIANGAVTNTKIAKNVINGTQIIDGSITNADVSTTAAIALSKLATGALPPGITVNTANIANLTTANLSPTAGITGGQIASGVALKGSASIDSPTFSIDSINHRVGIGTTTPLFPFDVLTSGINPARFGSSTQYAALSINAITANSNSTSGTTFAIGSTDRWFNGAAQFGTGFMLGSSIPVGTNPYGVAYDSSKGEMFVANSGGSSVSVISDSTNTVVATIPVGTSPFGVAYDSAKGEMFVVNHDAASVSVISDSTNTVVATITVGAGPLNVAYDSGKGEVFVTNFQSFPYTVSVISDATNAVVATIPVGAFPQGVAYDSAKGEMFVTNNDAASVSVISDSTNTVVATIPVGTFPQGVAYDSSKGEMFVANSGGSSVSVISDSTNTVVATIPISGGTSAVAYDSGKGEIFVANHGANSVSVISDSTNAVVATIPVGTDPEGVAYDPAMGEVFVANYGSNSVSVISESSNYGYEIKNDQTNTPALTIDGVSNQIAVSGSASIDSPTFSVDSVNHRVGIGTTTPLGNLDVTGDLLIGNNPSRAFPSGNSLYLSNDAGDSHNSFRLDGAGNNLYMIADSASGAGAGTGIIFRTAPSGGGELDRMSIDSSGNVKIVSGDISDQGAGNGLILKSSGGHCFKVTVSDTGIVTSSSITCP